MPRRRVGMSVLVVDDERKFYFDAEYARTLYDAVRLLLGGREWDEVWLDFDMGNQVTTRQLVQQIERMASGGIVLPVGFFVAHTANPVGREEIHRALDQFYKVYDLDAGKYLAHRS
jgi:hypothetical protein